MATTFRNALDPWELIVCDGEVCEIYDEDEKTGIMDCIGEYPDPG